MIITPETEAKVKLLISQNRKIEAIKLICDTNGCGLREAKDFVDGYAAANSPQAQAITNEDFDMQLMALLSQGKKLDAVKLYKNKTHLGLAESKDYIDNLLESARSIAIKTATGIPNKRDTQIDQILSQQSSQYGTSPKKVLLIILALVIVVGLLMYLFVAV